MKHQFEVTVFPERVRFRVGIKYRSNRTNLSWVKLHTHDSNPDFPNTVSTEGKIFSTLSVSDFIVQAIMTKEGEEMLRNVAKNVSVGQRVYVEIDNSTGEIISIEDKYNHE